METKKVGANEKEKSFNPDPTVQVVNIPTKFSTVTFRVCLT